MEIQDRHIVAIDLGTSKIALTVAKVEGENVQIVYYNETPSAGIRYSSVFNPTHAGEPLTEAVRQAETALGIKITQAVVGMPKYPIRLESNTGKIEGREPDADITAEDIAELKKSAEVYPLENPKLEAVYGAVAQSFSDGENFQIIEDDIIGMSSDVLEGNFKIFIGKKGPLNKIDTALKKADVVAIRKYFTADTTAKAVLTESEMANGVAMIDFGGGCTSVAIYCGNIMRHYASIPFGGNNITNDIQIESEGSINRELAENIKLAFGACMPDKLQSMGDKIIHIASSSGEADRKLPVKYLSEIITARVEEIMMAILYEIYKSGYADKLRSGIVVTGGGAQLTNLGNYIFDLSGYRVRTGYPKNQFSCQDCEGVTDTTATTSIGLVMTAAKDRTLNCAFSNDGTAPETTVKVETETDTPDGVLFKPEEVEVVKQKNNNEEHQQPSQKPRRVKWTRPLERIGKLFDDIYETVNQETKND